jgi:hypothetical protein
LLVIFLAAWAFSEITPPTNKPLIDLFEQDATVTDENRTLLETVVAEARRLEEANPGRTYANLFDAIGTNDITGLFPGINIATDEAQPVKVVLNDDNSDYPVQHTCPFRFYRKPEAPHIWSWPVCYPHRLLPTPRQRHTRYFRQIFVQCS